VVIVYLFGLRMKNWLTGLVAALILLVNKGFIGIHGARTGDYDILLTFFISLSLYLFYLYLQNRKAIYLISIAFSTGAAVLIKSAVGLLPLAVILLYLLFTKSIRQHLNKDSLYALLVFVFVTAPWFVLRFLRGSDFIVKMITVDILARSTTNKGCSLSSMQYLYYLITLNSHFGIALLILVAAGFMYLIYLIRKNKAFVLFAIWIALPIVAFAVAQCKHRWYLLPIYPALCLAASIMLDDLRAWFRARELLFLLCFVVLLTPLISSAVEPDEIFDDRTGESVKQLQKNLENVNLLYINETDNTQSIFFYLSLYCNCEVRTYKNIDEINETAEYSIITFEHRHGHKMEVRII
jgi:4-amino-4-deoxy-L-arabinose transferase-like glycosyltransferase